MNTENFRRFGGGLFITLEGLEGAGKSTVADRLAKFLREMNYEVVSVGEPGGTDLGRSIRRLFLENFGEITPESEVALLVAAKKHLLATVIEPALERDAIVVCDRYTESLFAYQGGALGYDHDMIQALLDAADAARRSDYVLYLDITAEESARRSKSRRDTGGEYSVVDAKELEFHEKLRAGFEMEMSFRNPKTVGRIDASVDLPQVLAAVQNTIVQRMREIQS